MLTYLIIRTAVWVIFCLVFFYLKSRALIDAGAKSVTRQDMTRIAWSTFLRVEYMTIGYAFLAYQTWRRNNPPPHKPYVS